MSHIFYSVHHPGDLVCIYGKLCVILKKLNRKEIMTFVGLGPYDIVVLPKWIDYGTYEYYSFPDGNYGICRGDYVQSI